MLRTIRTSLVLPAFAALALGACADEEEPTTNATTAAGADSGGMMAEEAGMEEAGMMTMGMEAGMEEAGMEAGMDTGGMGDTGMASEGGPMCPPEKGDDEATMCTRENCCAELTACQESEPCTCALACVLANATCMGEDESGLRDDTQCATCEAAKDPTDCATNFCIDAAMSPCGETVTAGLAPALALSNCVGTAC